MTKADLVEEVTQLGDLIRRLEPTPKAKYVAFTGVLDPGQMPGQKREVLEWPYVEGLRLDEATNPLAILAVGLYGQGGTTPNCLISKHEAGERIYLLWATDPDPPRVIASIAEITDAQITAIEPPRNEASWLDMGGHPHTESLRTTERFHRLSIGRMEMQITFENPKAYARPWTISLDASLAPDTEMLEYVCNENEKDRGHLVGRTNDEKKVTVPREVLAKYVGTYETIAQTGTNVKSARSLDLHPPDRTVQWQARSSAPWWDRCRQAECDQPSPLSDRSNRQPDGATNSER